MKMRREISLLIGVTVGAMLFVHSEGRAQQTRKFTYKTPASSQTYTQQHVLDVGDIPGHQVRILEIHVTPSPADAARYEDLRVIERWVRGYSDYTNVTGGAWGYALDMLENGDKIFWRWSGTTQTTVAPDGSKKAKYHGAGTITGGTGKMKGIRGTARDVVDGEWQGGKAVRVESESEVEYWFE